MKQTKYLTIFLAALLVISLVYLALDYSRQQKKQAAYNYQIESAAYSLSLMPTVEPDLEQQLAELDASNSAALQAISNESINSTTVINTLMTIADNCNLRLTPVTTESWINRQVGRASYNILPVEFQVQGSLNDLIDYLRAIENPRRYPYLVVAAIDIVNNREAPGLTGENGGSIVANLSVNIIIRCPQTKEELD